MSYNDESESFDATPDNMKFREQLEGLMDDIGSELEKIGIIPSLSTTAVPSSAFSDVDDIDPEEELRISHNLGTLSIFGKAVAIIDPVIAFSDRVILPPEEHEVNQATRAALPTEEELALEQMLASLEDREVDEE